MIVPFPIPESFRVCRTITTQANSSFPLAFRLLPSKKRRAMDALYAFMRVTDDIADEPGEVALKRERLAVWQAGLLASLDGQFTHPVYPALADTIRRFEIPVQYLLDVIDGVSSDLEPTRFATFSELYPYCYRVASAVGLACIHIWGLRPGVTFEQIRKPAEAAGIAFQLTNILRDLGEDLRGGRVYLPLDELERFRCPPDSWSDPAAQPAFQTMMRVQTQRAREYYRRAGPLERLLSAEGLGIFRVMCGTYRRLLDEIERSGFDVLTRRVRVPKWRKGLVLLDGWAAKRGWA
ncbi:MAG: squalene/phytoene synthase family protein [Planctomycetaceae bacterium]|nr:squalene/phytoene synthase family protein [Planctomycetaceae bacterium]